MIRITEIMKMLLVVLFSLTAIELYAQDNQSADSTKIYFIEEPMPSFPGGVEGLAKFFQKNVKLSREARKVEGKVYIGFAVNEDGSLSDFKVVKGLSEAFDKSVLEAFMKMPNRIPAKKNNRPIRTNMVLPYPIHFKK